MRKYPWHIWVTMAAVLAGILAMTQFKAQQVIQRNATANLRSEDILSALVQTEEQTQDLEREAASLRKTIANYQQTSDVTKNLEAELRDTRQKAGLEPLRGSGLMVTLNDSELKQEQGTDPNNYFIHESFLREIVNSFWTGGAEGVAVNDLRMASGSEIFCGGTTIFINKVLVAPPYTIKAIGDPKALKVSINMDVMPLLSSLQQQYGIRVDVRESSGIALPAFRKVPEFKYVKAVGVGE
ncbi:MAG TPA: DUF881 domain-containing protein [Bacillota bacterium]|nr:DUF881 domain-containing protein [Bacillota bacterium]